MKRLLLSLIITVIIGMLNAQENRHFTTDQPQGFSIENSNASGLSLHYTIPEISITNIDNGEEKGQEIVMKGSFGSFAEGQPNLPTVNQYIAVPKGAMVNIEVKEHGQRLLHDIDLLPVANVQGNNAVGLPKLRKDVSIFGKDASFPSESVCIAQSTQIRGLDVILINVTPFRYNPVRKTLEVIYDMDIEVRFEGGDGQFGDARYRNPDWDHLLRELVINADMLPETNYYNLLNETVRNHDEGCEYLIIAPDDDSIVAWANILKDFRTKQGILTKVVTTTECGGNESDAIKGYIKNAYDNWAIPPAAVMLFSGVDTLFCTANYYEATSGIPGFGLIFKNYDNGYNLTDYHYSSDNPYADMNDDSIPDIALSRLPAINLEEYSTQVNKIIQYETNPPTQPEFYDKPLITSSHEDNKWFLITSQAINGFFRNKLRRHPYNFYMVYAQNEPIIPDSAWSTGYNTEVVVDYFGPNGQNYIAQRPDTLNNWRNSMDYSYFVDALNHSSFLTLYRDHSSFDLWCSPWISSTEIRTYLANTMPTFLLSIGCDAGLYANTIFYESANSYIYYGEEPLIYEFCKAKVGALGGIGAVTVTHSQFNDILTWGIIDHIWPEFLPTLGSANKPVFVRPSYALVAGKLFLGQHAFLPNWWPTKITTTCNVFHDLGEAYLNLYTETPQPINAEFPVYYPDNQLEYTFNVEEGALVCLSKDGQIIYVGQATGNPQSVTLPQMNIGDHFTVTATLQNHFRVEKEVTIIPNDQSYVYLKEALLIDQNANGQLDYGEFSSFYFELNNVGNYATQGAQITLLCDDPYVTLLQTSASYPNLEAGVSITLNNVFKIKIANNVPDQTPIRFGLQFNDGSNIHTDFFEFLANAPLIQIDPDFRPMTADGKPSTHISTEGTSSIAFNLKNIGHSTAELLSSAFDIKAPFVTVENPIILYENLLPNESTTATFNLKATSNAITGAWLQSLLQIQYGDYQASLDTIIPYGGFFENFETDTLNPYFLWTKTGKHPWVYTEEDAYEGERCLKSTATLTSSSVFKAKARSAYVGHNCKISFYLKTSKNEYLDFYTKNSNDCLYLTAEEWQYVEIPYNGKDGIMCWRYRPTASDSLHASIDDLCFPPEHTAIAFAGKDVMACGEAPLQLLDAYAYDCDSILWTTDGDGSFDCDTIANPIYSPGSQDIENKNVTLTLFAFGNDTVISTTQIHFIDDLTLGAIIGDSVINKYTTFINHYSVENQEGIHYIWNLDPAESGIIYNYGNEIDIHWNNFEGDADVTLSVTADNGCDIEPISKLISLVGTETNEWQTPRFSLFPNPSDGMVRLMFDEQLIGGAIIEVYNLLGERIICKNISSMPKNGITELDLSMFTPGLYIVKLNTEKGYFSKKVSIK